MNYRRGASCLAAEIGLQIARDHIARAPSVGSQIAIRPTSADGIRNPNNVC